MRGYGNIHLNSLVGVYVRVVPTSSSTCDDPLKERTNAFSVQDHALKTRSVDHSLLAASTSGACVQTSTRHSSVGVHDFAMASYSSPPGLGLEKTIGGISGMLATLCSSRSGLA